MKKIAFLLLCLLTFMLLVSCGGPSGVYKDEAGNATFVFEGSVVEFSLGSISYRGSYEIKGDTLYITYGDGSSPVELSFSYENHTDYILINNVKYIKQ